LKTLFARALALLWLVLPAQGGPLSGTKSVGPTGNYLSITAAIADVQAQSLGGALVLELQPLYLGVVETFPLTIPALNGASAVNTLTIRPATGATALSVSSADYTAATVDLNGAQFVIIDGRPGGVGSHAGSGGGAASQLTIANTEIDGVALRFINEASGNILRYLTLQGVSLNIQGGTVVFSDTMGPNGNDNNTVDHCDIGDGASTPSTGIYSAGSTGTTAQANSGNTVSNCNVFNFYADMTGGNSAGVRLDNGNTDWTLTGNSFYQTASRPALTANMRAISIASGSNFTVTGNFIGGSAPNAGGTPWTAGDIFNNAQFVGIHLNIVYGTPSSVQGNVIANFVWTSSSNAQTLPGSVSASLTGIVVTDGANTISNNTVGSTITANSLNAATSSTSGTSQQVTGILNSAMNPGSTSITGNTVVTPEACVPPSQTELW
jgi:hypothetical protein